MGITGLLPLLEKASKKCNVAEFSGCTVAVDTYCWLHKGAFSCADKIARGEFTDAHIKYCMKYVNMLLSHSIKPVLVFDGRHLPAKALTEAKRRESRSIAKKRAAELLRLGQVDEARSYMRRCVDITHEMALLLIKECRQRNVDCIVAPYEADAQMAYLNKINIADVIITEDSDLILFGCSKVFFKMDLNGNGVLVESSKLPLVMKCPLEHYNFNKFRQMCIMSGCDYLASLPGIGLAKARQFINATRDPDIRNALKKLPSYFNKNQMVVTDEYRDSFVKAEATFKHQLVYDPIQRKLLPLNSLESEGTDIEFCSNAGEHLDPEIAYQLALGNLDPFSLKKMDDWDPDHAKEAAGGKTNGWNQMTKAPHRSIWSRDYMDHAKRPSLTKSKTETAILSFPSTKRLSAKIQVVTSEESKENGLTIADLSSMYCIKETVKQNVIIPETQDFDDIDFATSKNPFGMCATSAENSLNNESLSARKRRRTASTEKENSPSPEKDGSPILESRNRNFKRLLKTSSFSKLSRLSKFQRTTIDENNFVESKFFTSTNESTCKVDEESGLNVSGIAKLNVDEIEESPMSNKDRLSDIIDPIDESIHNKHLTMSDDLSWTMKSSETINLSTFENKKSVNPFGKSSIDKLDKVLDSQTSYNENTYPLEDLVTPVASQMSANDSQNTSEQFSQILTKPIFSRQKSTSTFLSQPSTGINSSDSLSKNGLKSNSCRRPGLQRKTSAPVLSAGQKTLANFGFFQKSQLKH